MPLSISLLCASWLVIWRSALLPWGVRNYHDAPRQALVITERPKETLKMRGGCSLMLSAALQPCWAQHAAWAPGQACQQCLPEPSRSIRKVNWGLPSHMKPLISTLIAKRQQRRGRIWHPTSLHLSPSTSRSCWQPFTSSLLSTPVFWIPFFSFSCQPGKHITELQSKLCYQ